MADLPQGWCLARTSEEILLVHDGVTIHRYTADDEAEARLALDGVRSRPAPHAAPHTNPLPGRVPHG